MVLNTVITPSAQFLNGFENCNRLYCKKLSEIKKQTSRMPLKNATILQLQMVHCARYTKLCTQQRKNSNL